MTAKTIAITGASGFVGQAALAALIPLGHRLRLLVRDAGARKYPPEIELVEGTLADRDGLLRLCEGADTVIHIAGAIAALSRPGFMAVNADGTARLVEVARQKSVGRFVHVSSVAAREPSLSPYAESKRAGEMAVQKLAGTMEHVILRPPAVYGAPDKATLPLFRQLTARSAYLPGRPGQRVSLLHVRDLAAALAFAATAADAPTGATFEIDDGKPNGYSWAEICAIASAHEGHAVVPHLLPRGLLAPVAWLAGLLARLTGRPSILTPAKLNELYHADWVVRGPRFLPWRAELSFAAGFADTVSAYRRAGSLRASRAAIRKHA